MLETFVMNKKGGEKYLSVWWFFILTIVAGGTLIAIWRFQNVVNASELDAEVLASKVVDCIVKNGILVFDINEPIRERNKPDIFSLCEIKQFDKSLGKDYFLGILIYDFSSCEIKNEEWFCNKLIKEFYYSPSEYLLSNLKERCVTFEGFEVSRMPRCAYKNVYALGKNNEKFIVRVIGGTNEK